VSRPGRRTVDIAEGSSVWIDDHGVGSRKRCKGIVIKKVTPSTYVVKDKSDVLKKDMLIRS